MCVCVSEGEEEYKISSEKTGKDNSDVAESYWIDANNNVNSAVRVAKYHNVLA